MSAKKVCAKEEVRRQQKADPIAGERSGSRQAKRAKMKFCRSQGNSVGLMLGGWDVGGDLTFLCRYLGEAKVLAASPISGGLAGIIHYPGCWKEHEGSQAPLLSWPDLALRAEGLCAFGSPSIISHLPRLAR